MAPVYHRAMQSGFELKRLFVLILTGIVAVSVWLSGSPGNSVLNPYLQVHFLDVGQGDATLIETPDGVQVLIDGGAGSAILRQLASTLPAQDWEIDVVVATHPDQDHIGGLIDVLERYQVAAVIGTEQENDSQTAEQYQQAVIDENATIITAQRGQVLSLGASTTLEILYPDGPIIGDDMNAGSVIAKLVYGETSFLLTGDAPKRIEEYLMLAEGEHLQSTVLKVGHHGSRTSTSELFLAEVNPEYAVISAGADNRYGHPHVEVTDLLFNYGIPTYSTAEQGSITFLSDGISVWIE